MKKNNNEWVLIKKLEAAVVGVFFAVTMPALFSANVASALSSSSASSSEATAIRTEITTLLEKVEQLKQQLKELQQGSMGTSTPQREKPKRICPLIARVLLSGTQGDDVKSLQEFLAEEGYLDRGSVSAYFGPLTQSALRKWQAAEGIISSGDAASTGWGVVGPRTREFILKRCGGFREDRPLPPFGTSTRPNFDKRPMGNACPTLAMPPLATCHGKLKLEWKSQASSSLKCLAWECHSNDDDESDDDDDAATSTNSD